MKIKLDDTFKRLGILFGLSSVHAGRISYTNVPRLAAVLKSLIYFPPFTSVKKALPIPFRTKYHQVQSITDCFEIEIEKTSDSLKQSLTCSDYKNCNTIKYLVSMTPIEWLI